MIGQSRERGTWRNSYDVEDARAQVATIHWDRTPNNPDALKFFDAFAMPSSGTRFTYARQASSCRFR